jgi:hypothetical protein
MSEIKIEDLSARVANLEAWVETAMRLLSRAQVEPVLIKLERARGSYGQDEKPKSETMRRLTGMNAGT